MQLLLVRHALPLRSEPGQGSDPDLSDDGIEQAKRLPDALARFPITRLVSSPQLRAVQTAQPVADALGLTVDIDDRLAEYDRDLAHYIPIEETSQEDLQRLIDGHLPGSVDEDAFHRPGQGGGRRPRRGGGPRGHRRGVQPRRRHQRAGAQHPCGTERLLCVQVDYAGVTRLLSSRDGNAVSPRSTAPSTYGTCCRETSDGRQVRVTTSLEGLDLDALDRHLQSVGIAAHR